MSLSISLTTKYPVLLVTTLSVLQMTRWPWRWSWVRRSKTNQAIRSLLFPQPLQVLPVGRCDRRWTSDRGGTIVRKGWARAHAQMICVRAHIWHLTFDLSTYYISRADPGGGGNRAMAPPPQDVSGGGQYYSLPPPQARSRICKELRRRNNLSCHLKELFRCLQLLYVWER